MHGIIHRLSNLQTTGACLLKNVYRYYREKFHVNQFWELKGKGSKEGTGTLLSQFPWLEILFVRWHAFLWTSVKRNWFNIRTILSTWVCLFPPTTCWITYENCEKKHFNHCWEAKGELDNSNCFHHNKSIEL